MKKWKQREAAELLASIGVAMLIAGYLRYSIQSELLLFSKITLVAGGVLLLAGIVLGYREIVHFFSKRSSQLGTNTTVLALAVIAILAIANFVGFRHHKRFDLTTEKLFTLSDQTKKVVGGLDKDVTVVLFSKGQDESSQAVSDLMAEYRNLSPRIHFEDVDPQQKPEVARGYGATHIGQIIVASGDRKEPIEPSFEGPPSEQDITSAILKVTRNTIKTVCFVTGHGEKSLADSGADGYSQVDQGLKKEGYATDSVNLVSSSGVPSNCDVVVIAGPKQGYFPQEAAMVSKYLEGGGKVLVEADPETDPKLGDIFQAWNIKVGDNVVVDASGVGQLFGTGPAVPLVANYGDSPITKALAGGMTFFPLARTVAIADKSKYEAQGVELLKTSPQSFTIPNLKQKEVKFDPKTDTPGPLSLGVAASKNADDKSARLVVIGNSAFATNQWGGLQRNGDLFFNSIDWLAQDENLISIRPKAAANRSITMTESQAALLRWLDLFFLPAIVIFSGVVIWWKRR